MTGNGMTLCRKCHRHAHEGYNGRPDVSLPMDAQGGEKIELLAELYGVLAEAAKAGLHQDARFYHLSEQVLSKFKLLQGFGAFDEFAGLPVRRAASIWNAPQTDLMRTVVEANLAPGEGYATWLKLSAAFKG